MLGIGGKELGGRDGAKMRLGLALSGGGIRAAVFHLGVLRCLADRGALEEVTHVSTVSGGSLITAAILSANNLEWPTSAAYRENIFPSLRAMLGSRDLFSLGAIGVGGILRHGGELIARRADMLVRLLQQQWNVRAGLRDLPDSPVWWINTTCLETGKNWRFAKREMGDWQFGRHYAPPYSIAQAAAASAAVPYAIGALHLKLPADGWYAANPSDHSPLRSIKPPLDAVRLWDGGVYENLGLEPLYKPARGLIGCDLLICSDASGPLSTVPSGPLRSLFRGQLASPRLFDIASDQIRALRSRMIMDSVARSQVRAVLLRMGNSTRSLDLKSGRTRQPLEYEEFSSESDVAAATNHPTDLNAVSCAVFDRIARHGYEVADHALTTYAPEQFQA